MFPQGSRLWWCLACITAVGVPGLAGLPEPAAGQVPSVLEALRSSRSVLWVGAHPDDETVAAGLLARAKDVAGKLYLLSLTRGENSPDLWDGLCRGSQIGRARAALFSQSARILRADGYALGPFVNGPHSLEDLDRQCPPGAPFRGWPPGTRSRDVLAKWRREGDPVQYLVGELRKWRPDAVVAMDGYCGVSGNPEHIAVGRLLLETIPVAADPDAYASAGPAWRVRYVIFSAHVAPAVIKSGYRKCEGDKLEEPVERVSTLEQSETFGGTYFRVAARVSMHYQNVMQSRGWTEGQIESQCERMEKRAREAYNRGARMHPIVESYRLIRPK